MKKTTIQALAITMLIGGSMATLSSCKKEGCTEPNATNYSEKAKKDDGSCTYAQTQGTVTKSGIL